MHYIMENPASAPAYFALFQTVNGSLIFNPISNPDDIKFVGAVATAWDANYPGTSRTENLHNIAIQGMKNTKRPTPVSLEDIDPGKISAAGIIDIELPDIHGKNRKLSDIRNKVVLLDFTAYSLPSSQERIMQMRDCMTSIPLWASTFTRYPSTLMNIIGKRHANICPGLASMRAAEKPPAIWVLISYAAFLPISSSTATATLWRRTSK